MTEYKYNKRENKFTENGHVMFEFDVLQRLKRLAVLEDQIKQGQLSPMDSVSDCDAIFEQAAKLTQEEIEEDCRNIPN